MLRGNFSPIRRPLFVTGPSIAYLPLSGDQFSLVDSDTANDIARWNWHVRKPRTSSPAYAMRKVMQGGVNTNVHLHRYILALADPSIRGDHRNGNGLDNRRANLRTATEQQNQFNGPMKANNKSGFKGVRASREKFQATIRVDGRPIYLGTFVSPELAHIAYCEAAKRYAGEFARTV